MVRSLIGNSLEGRVARLQELRRVAKKAVVAAFDRQFQMSWIYHDSLLEGVAYTQDELVTALSNDEIASDTALIPVFDEIRNHKAAIDHIHAKAVDKSTELSLETLKDLFAILAPEELEGKSPKYRKDSPPHRPYFHDVLPPEKISYQMRQLLTWVAESEKERTVHPIRLAARAHHEMLHIYPFTKQNGKVARLFMNLVMLKNGYPPVVLHSTERQRYYDVLRTSDDATAQLVSEALGSNVETAITYFEQGL